MRRFARCFRFQKVQQQTEKDKLSVDNCSLANLIDVTLACEDAYSKLVEVVTVTDVDDENLVGNSLLQIWKLRFGHKA